MLKEGGGAGVRGGGGRTVVASPQCTYLSSVKMISVSMADGYSSPRSVQNYYEDILWPPKEIIDDLFLTCHRKFMLLYTPKAR